MNERPTPETDAVWADTSLNILEHARRLERQRDDLLDKLTSLELRMPEELARLERERDAERALADRLAQFIDLITDALGPYQYLNGTLIVRDAYHTLTAWKEARNDN